LRFIDSSLFKATKIAPDSGGYPDAVSTTEIQIPLAVSIRMAFPICDRPVLRAYLSGVEGMCAVGREFDRVGEQVGDDLVSSFHRVYDGGAAFRVYGEIDAVFHGLFLK
jgi:hypothetical protein